MRYITRCWERKQTASVSPLKLSERHLFARIGSVRCLSAASQTTARQRPPDRAAPRHPKYAGATLNVWQPPHLALTSEAIFLYTFVNMVTTLY